MVDSSRDRRDSGVSDPDNILDQVRADLLVELAEKKDMLEEYRSVVFTLENEVEKKDQDRDDYGMTTGWAGRDHPNLFYRWFLPENRDTQYPEVHFYNRCF